MVIREPVWDADISATAFRSCSRVSSEKRSPVLLILAIFLNRNWQNRQKMEAAIEAMHLEIRKLNHPTPHRFVLEKKGK